MVKRNDRQRWATQQVFTTGEAAEVCTVSQQTIIRCFDTGRLTGFRVPGSRFRRIPREDLLRFMKDNRIPTTPLENVRKRVLIVENDKQIVEMFVYALERDGRFEVSTAPTGYDAGIMTEQLKPDLIVLDASVADANPALVCRRVKSDPERRTAMMVIFNGLEPGQMEAMRSAGVDEMVRKPFNVGDVIRRMNEMVAG